MAQDDPGARHEGAKVQESFGDVTVAVDDRLVATVEIHRPPNNHFDLALIRSLADAYETVGERSDCRVILLCSEGRHFCAGADFGEGSPDAAAAGIPGIRGLYREAARLFRSAVPVVAVVQGAAVGGGLGLACSADFRVASAGSRFTANFVRLGFHHGFGLTATLPPIVGQQRALELLYTGKRIGGVEALEIGLCDRLAEAETIRQEGLALAGEIAASAPLAVRSIRQTMRKDLFERIDQALEREASEQDRLRQTKDWAEGVQATAERREPRFWGR